MSEEVSPWRSLMTQRRHGLLTAQWRPSTTPQDHAAEQSITGGMSEQDAIAPMYWNGYGPAILSSGTQGVYDADLGGENRLMRRWPPNWIAVGCCAASAVLPTCT